MSTSSGLHDEIEYRSLHVSGNSTNRDLCRPKDLKDFLSVGYQAFESSASPSVSRGGARRPPAKENVQVMAPVGGDPIELGSVDSAFWRVFLRRAPGGRPRRPFRFDSGLAAWSPGPKGRRQWEKNSQLYERRSDNPRHRAPVTGVRRGAPWPRTKEPPAWIRRHWQLSLTVMFRQITCAM